MFKKILFVLMVAVTVSCSNDDDTQEPESPSMPIVPDIAITAIDLLTGESGFVLSWEDNDFQSPTVINLKEELGFEFGFQKNTIGSEITIAAGFPADRYIYYDLSTGIQRDFTNFFNPSGNPTNTFSQTTDNAIVTYYLDESTTCCDIYFNSYSLQGGVNEEVFLGNADISPVQNNIYVKNDKAFGTADNTFTGANTLYVNNAVTGSNIGILDVQNYSAFLYNDKREEVYLFDFNGTSLSYNTLSLATFSVGEQRSFPAGFSVISGFNDAKFTENTIVYSSQTSGLPAIYRFDTDTLTIYDDVDIFNIIFNEYGIGFSPISSAVDIENNVMVISGTYLLNGQDKGVAVFMTLDREPLDIAFLGDYFPQEIIFK